MSSCDLQGGTGHGADTELTEQRGTAMAGLFAGIGLTLILAGLGLVWAAAGRSKESELEL